MNPNSKWMPDPISIILGIFALMTITTFFPLPHQQQYMQERQ